MNHDIHQQVSQRGDGAQDAENRRIAEIADELDRLCRVHEAEPGSGEADVKHHELEQRAAEQMAKARGFWFPMMDVVRLGVPGPSGHENDTYVAETGIFLSSTLR